MVFIKIKCKDGIYLVDIRMILGLKCWVVGVIIFLNICVIVLFFEFFGKGRLRVVFFLELVLILFIFLVFG